MKNLKRRTPVDRLLILGGVFAMPLQLAAIALFVWSVCGLLTEPSYTTYYGVRAAVSLAVIVLIGVVAVAIGVHRGEQRNP